MTDRCNEFSFLCDIHITNVKGFHLHFIKSVTKIGELVSCERTFSIRFTVTRLGSTPVGIYLLKVTNKNTRTRCEICSKLTIKTPPERGQGCRSGVFIVNFEHI